MLRFFFYIGVAIACLAGLLGALAGLFLLNTPRPTDIRSCITAKMFNVKLCPTDPSYVKLKDISPNLRNAVIVSEDSAFYGHNGFDWSELRESFETNLEKGEFARGGSTLTQQLAKNVYLTSEKSLLRKVREALITIQLEELLSKDEILEKYLNVVEFGPGLYGIGKASRFYFAKAPSQLSPAESAFLAFLLPSPKKHSVSFQKKQLTKFAYKQTQEIVNRLLRFKRISEAEHQESLAQLQHLFGGSVAAQPAGSEDASSSDEDMEMESNDSSSIEGAPVDEAG